MTAAPASSPAPELDYDLHLRTETGFRLVWRIPDHGVRLFADRVGWTAGGRAASASFDDIVEIHLTRGGGIFTGGSDPQPWMRLIAQRRAPYMSVCRIRFHGGGVLVVIDGDASGFATPERSAQYSDFVVRLHERLATRPHDRIVFGAGYSPFCYRMLLFLMSLLGLLFLGGIVAFFVQSSVRSFFLLVGAIIWFVFQWRMIRGNVPRRYIPEAVPDDLLPAAATRTLRAPIGAAHGFPTSPGLTAALEKMSPRWLWLLALPGLAMAAAIVWSAGTSERAAMLEPGQAQRAFAAVEQQAGEVLHLRRLEVTPRRLSIAVEAMRTHVDSHGFVSRMENWTVTRTALFGGWREWDSVSGPHKADSLPVLEESSSEPFALRPRDLPDLSRMAADAIAHSGIADAIVRRMTLVNHFAIVPIAGQDPLRWSVQVASLRESAEVTFDHQGRFAGADLAGTLRRRNLNLLAGGKDFDAVLRAVHGKLGDGAALAFMSITPSQIVLRTDDKQYEADLDGITDKTPQPFLCHMMTDIMTGRFRLDTVGWSLLAALQERAIEAAPNPGSQVAAIVLSAAKSDDGIGARANLQWSIETVNGGQAARVVFDDGGRLLGVRASNDRHSCD